MPLDDKLLYEKYKIKIKDLAGSKGDGPCNIVVEVESQGPE